MKQYLGIMQEILDHGIKKEDRTGTGTLSIFGTQAKYDLSEGFPLLTTKKLFIRGIIEELLWIISGSGDISELRKKNVHIWDAWEDPTGEKYAPYGPMWRAWPKRSENAMYTEYGMLPIPETIDQLGQVIEEIKKNPGSRRLIVNAWNPGEMKDFVLPPCHAFFQFNVRGEYLDLQLYQRSADWFLGVPFNIASYSLLLMMVAKLTGYKCGTFIHTTGDTHLYLNHLEQAKLQLSREPKPLPKMIIYGDQKTIDDFKYEDFELVDYDPWPAIKAEVSV